MRYIQKRDFHYICNKYCETLPFNYYAKHDTMERKAECHNQELTLGRLRKRVKFIIDDISKI